MIDTMNHITIYYNSTLYTGKIDSMMLANPNRITKNFLSKSAVLIGWSSIQFCYTKIKLINLV